MRAVLIWVAFAAALAVPVAVAATSPLLAWRSPVYIVAGLAGVIALGLLLVQPLLAGGYLPAIGPRPARRVHAWTGVGLTTAVVVHVGALWVTSPPDVMDALLLDSPTPFSTWGVAAMWAVFATALLAVLRRRLRPRLWRLLHLALAGVIVIGGTVHAMLIEGTMGMASKALLCALVVAAAAKAMIDRGLGTELRRMIGGSRRRPH